VTMPGSRVKHLPLGLVVAGAAALVTAGIVLLVGVSTHGAPSRTRSAAPAAPAAALGVSPPGVVVPPPPEPARGATADYPAIHWRHSTALGQPWHGRLRHGVLLPANGRDYVTWDPILFGYPNRADRRWGTARLIKTLLYVLDRYRRAHPRAPRVLVSDLSRPHGGFFGRRYGGLGHASHQSGLDVDVLYPRKDGKELPAGPREMDRRLSQDLVDRFVAAYAQFVFVGPHTGLRGPRGVVQALVNHDDHMHVRVYAR
jgi:Penicillin-insensitive murein endopeptidase